MLFRLLVNSVGLACVWFVPMIMWARHIFLIFLPYVIIGIIAEFAAKNFFAGRGQSFCSFNFGNSYRVSSILRGMTMEVQNLPSEQICNAIRSRQGRDWVVEYEKKLQITGKPDGLDELWRYFNQVKLKFPTLEQAKGFAEAKGWTFYSH